MLIYWFSLWRPSTAAHMGDNIDLTLHSPQRSNLTSVHMWKSTLGLWHALPVLQNSRFQHNVHISWTYPLSYFYYWYSVTHSLFHSRLKSFLFCESSLPQPFLSVLQDSLYGFPRLFRPTATSEHIRLFYFLVSFLFLHFLVVGSVR